MGLPLPFARAVKRVLPRSLLGRSLLMILIPLVLLQAVALQIYYGGHLSLVYRRLSGGVAGDLAIHPAAHAPLPRSGKHRLDHRDGAPRIRSQHAA